MKQVYDLTKEEIIQIVNDIFSPKKITNIKIHKRDMSVSCTIYSDWYTKDENGNEEVIEVRDNLTLRNPFDNGFYEAIEFEDSNYPTDREDLKIFKRFCYAKGILPEYLIEDNPYLQKEPNKIISELGKIKAEIEEANVHLNQMPSNDYYSGIRQGHWGDLQIIEKHIAELKGDKNV